MNLSINIDITLTGFGVTDIDDILSDIADIESREGKELEDLDSDKYTQKIVAPTYTPTGEKPEIKELIDEGKSLELIKKIEEIDIPQEDKEFLIKAAKRHTVFNFAKIAEYYCHTSEKI